MPNQSCVEFAIEVKVPLLIDFHTGPVKGGAPLLPLPAKYIVVPSALPVMPLGSPKIDL